MAISFHQSATVQLWYTATAVQSVVFWPSHIVSRPLGSRPLLLFLLLVLRGLLLLLGLLVLRNLLLGLGFLILWAQLLVGLVLWVCLVGLVSRGLLLVRSTEEAREETQLRKQNQDQQYHYHNQKTNYQPGGSAAPVCPPSALLVHFPLQATEKRTKTPAMAPLA
jgi:hypothetical protein